MTPRDEAYFIRAGMLITFAALLGPLAVVLLIAGAVWAS